MAIIKDFDITQAREQYINAQPFPNIVFNNFVDPDLENAERLAKGE